MRVTRILATYRRARPKIAMAMRIEAWNRMYSEQGFWNMISLLPAFGRPSFGFGAETAFLGSK